MSVDKSLGRTDVYASYRRRLGYDLRVLVPYLCLCLVCPHHGLGSALNRVVDVPRAFCVLPRPLHRQLSYGDLYHLLFVFHGHVHGRSHGSRLHDGCYGSEAFAHHSGRGGERT